MDLTEEDDDSVAIEILPAKDVPGYQRDIAGAGVLEQ